MTSHAEMALSRLFRLLAAGAIAVLHSMSVGCSSSDEGQKILQLALQQDPKLPVTEKGW
jgi:hypothetical protein